MLACYEKERKRFTKAKEYCEQAVATDLSMAFLLKSMWLSGNEVYPRDENEIVRYAVLAAKSEHPEALLWLGALHGDKLTKGLLRAKDYVNGRPVYFHYLMYHFTQAAMQGSEHGKDMAKEVVKELDSSSPVAWQLFERDYPQHAKYFIEITGYKPK
jgi:hypothetical protein